MKRSVCRTLTVMVFLMWPTPMTMMMAPPTSLMPSPMTPRNSWIQTVMVLGMSRKQKISGKFCE